MFKNFRSVLLAGIVAVGVAACGDDVTVVDPPAPPPPPAPTVKSISVTPDGTTLTVGQTRTFSAAVVADEGVATTVTWSTSDAAVASINATSGVATGVTPGSVGIKATSTVNPAVQGNATLTVTAAATATVTGVTVAPSSIALTAGNVYQAAATVQGTNNPSQTVTWSSTNTAVATVNPTTGLITAVAAGGAQIRATSTANTAVFGSMAVTVSAVTPGSVTLVGLTVGNLNTPVPLTNVNGQIEATLDVQSGGQQLDRVDLIISNLDGAGSIIRRVVIAQQFFTGGGSVSQEVTLSFNTNQLRKVNNLYVPSAFNGPSTFSAELHFTSPSGPTASNAIPGTLNNNDMMIGATTLAAAPTAGPVVVAGTSWYKGNVSVSGGNYVSFFPVAPTSITLASNLCGNSGNLIGTQTPQTGIALAGTFTCGNTVEAAVNLTGAYAVTPGTSPQADVLYGAAAGYTIVGSAFAVDGENRYNPLTGSAPSLSSIAIDNKAPVITANPIGFLAGGIAGGDAAPNNCEETGITPGCWTGSTYNLFNDFTATDGGSLVDGSTAAIWQRNGALITPCTSTAFSIASAAENTSPTAYDVCYNVADFLGNVAGKVAGFNLFGVDKTPPTLAYVGGYSVATVNPPEVNVLPLNTSAQDTVNYSLTDNNSGVDATVGLTVTFTRLLNNGGVPSTTACSNPVNTLTGSGTTPQFMLSPYLISSCTLPGERTWNAVGRDRAGNQNLAGAFSRQLEYNPVAPTINAVNIVPNYGAGANIAIDVLASDDEDLRSGEMWAHYTTNLGTDIRVVFGPRLSFFSGIWGADWDANLYLNTILGTDSRLTVPASWSLGGFAEDATVGSLGPAAAVDTLSTLVYDTFGAASAGWVTPLNVAFVNTASYATANPWSVAPGLAAVLTPAINTVGTSCNFSYATPTNNPEIISRLWIVNDNGAGLGQLVTVLAEINGAPTLVSDNGIQRLYRHTISSTVACANIGGTGIAANNIIAIKSGTNAANSVGVFLFALLP